MKNNLLPFIFLVLFFACSKKDDLPLDESTLEFQEGFVDRVTNGTVRAILPSQKSVLFLSSLEEENRLVKYNLSSRSNEWQAKTWYRELPTRTHKIYLYEEVVLFRDGHHDFAFNLENGNLLYDELRLDCPDSRLEGIDHHYFSTWAVMDTASELKKEIILIGDIRVSDLSEILVSPPYASNGDGRWLGRIMNVDPFENESGEVMLAVRYYDYDANNSIVHRTGIYNVSTRRWLFSNIPLEHHLLHTQTLIAGDHIYYGSYEILSCVDAKTGLTKWVTEAFATASSKSVVAIDGDVIFKSLNGTVQRRNGTTGELIWEKDLGRPNQLLLLKDKLFYVNNQGFSITDIESGELIKSFSSPYVNYEGDDYFIGKSSVLGFYDAESDYANILLNVGENFFHYQLAN